MFLYSDSAIKSIDAKAINEYCISSLQLQESAAFLCFEAIKKYISKSDRGVVVVGKGNNGADGLALARLLHLANYNISIYYFSPLQGSSEYEAQKKIASRLGLPTTNELSQFDYLIDALIGVGCKKDLSDEYISIIERINNLDIKVFSIDMPTGIGFESNSKTVINADHTFTLGASKAALYLNGNRAKCGNIELLSPLFPSFENIKAEAKLIDIDSLSILPFESDAYKKTRGDLIIVGSSKEYPSTVLLSSRAAFRSGIGLITIYTENEVVPYLVNENPSLMVRPFSSFIPNEKAVLLLGPGLGGNNDDSLLPFLKIDNKKVIDADGIRAYCRLYRDGRVGICSNAILTPHLGELKVLLETFVPALSLDTPKEYLEALKALSIKLNATIVIKSEVAIVVAEDEVSIVDLVNPSLAVAGSGDALAAIIATLCINSTAPALNGVLHHKKAGMKAKEKYGYYSALELIEMVGMVR